MGSFFETALSLLKRWYVLLALAVLTFPIIVLVGSMCDIDNASPSHRVTGSEADKVFSLFESLDSKYSNSHVHSFSTGGGIQLFGLLFAEKLVDVTQKSVLSALVVGYIGYSLDTGCHWLRKRQRRVKP
jgi:hypothetical protein